MDQELSKADAKALDNIAINLAKIKEQTNRIKTMMKNILAMRSQPQSHIVDLLTPSEPFPVANISIVTDLAPENTTVLVDDCENEVVGNLAVEEPQIVSHSLKPKLIFEDESMIVSVVDAEVRNEIDFENVDLVMESSSRYLNDGLKFRIQGVRQNAYEMLIYLLLIEKPPPLPPEVIKDILILHWPERSDMNLMHWPKRSAFGDASDLPMKLENEYRQFFILTKKVWKSMEALIEMVLVGVIGVSNFSIDQIKEFLKFAKIVLKETCIDESMVKHGAGRILMDASCEDFTMCIVCRYLTTELASDIVVKVGEMIFFLHKFPLLCKCARFQKLVGSANAEDDEFWLPDIPGGIVGFELELPNEKCSGEGGGRKVELQVERSIMYAFERAEKVADSDFKARKTHPLVIFAEGVKLIAETVFKVFSPVLRQWYSAAGFVMSNCEKNSLIQMETTCGSLLYELQIIWDKLGEPDSEMVFRTMNEGGIVPDITTYSYLVKTYEKLGKLQKVSELLKGMESYGNLSDISSYNILLEAHVEAGSMKEEMSVLRQLQGAECGPNTSTYSILLHMFVRHGRYDDVREPFLEMKVSNTEPDAETYNRLKCVFGEVGYFKEVVTLFHDMVGENVEPNMETYEGLIYVTDAGQQHHFDMVFNAARKAEVVRLVDLLDEAKTRSKEAFVNRGMDAEWTEEEFEQTAEAIGYETIKYADLKNDILTNYTFHFDQMLIDKGNTTVYLLYALMTVLDHQLMIEAALRSLSKLMWSLDANEDAVMGAQRVALEDLLKKMKRKGDYAKEAANFTSQDIVSGFAFSVCINSQDWFFSLPRPPEIVDLEDKVAFKGQGMLRIGKYGYLRDLFVFSNNKFSTK